MKLRIKFIIFIALMHGVMGLMAAFLLKYNTAMFVITELLILVSVILSIRIYRAFVMPLDIMAAGLESLKEKDFSMKFVKTGQFELDQLIEVYNKMIDQLREERISTNEQHHFLEKILKASPSGVMILDYDHKIQTLNPAAQQYIAMPTELVFGNLLSEVNHPLLQQLANLQPNTSSIIQVEGSRSFKCHKTHFIHRGFHQHFIIIEELTSEILKTEKQAYEKVVRMMSHEINNTVGAVNSILDSLVKTKLKEDEEFTQILQVCTDRNKRMAKFMANFAEVVRLPQVKKEEKDLHACLKNVALLFKETLDQRNIKLSLMFSDGKYPLLFDEQQMEQVLINVLKNAVDSIEKDGDITIITSKEPGQLIIRDTGKGVEPAMKNKLFTPFFSSKKEGQGIGLTLSKEILHNHGFRFSLETKSERVTEFVIWF